MQSVLCLQIPNQKRASMKFVLAGLSLADNRCLYHISTLIEPASLVYQNQPTICLHHIHSSVAAVSCILSERNSTFVQ